MKGHQLCAAVAAVLLAACSVAAADELDVRKADCIAKYLVRADPHCVTTNNRGHIGKVCLNFESDHWTDDAYGAACKTIVEEWIKRDAAAHEATAAKDATTAAAAKESAAGAAERADPKLKAMRDFARGLKGQKP